MKKQLLLLITIIFSLCCYSQISFEKGYYINNTDKKIDCLIKNIDWKNNPTEFKYKTTGNSAEQKATIKSVKEFGIYNISKYIRDSVKIDRSSHVVRKMSNVRKAVFNEEELFLKVLIEGKSNLYLYEDGELIRYFYSKDNSEVEQLIYKKYLNFEDKIGTNVRYKQQLWTNLKCSTIKLSKIERIEYKKKDLISFFEEYNKCKDQKYINFEEKQKRDLFNLNIRPGINYSSLYIQNAASGKKHTVYDNKFTFRFGMEAEFILPYNKNRWAIIVEPTYQSYKSEEPGDPDVKTEYTSIELPFGLRHNFFLNKNSKIFINGQFIIDFPINSSYIDHYPGANLEIETRNNYAFGIGYNKNDRYSLEFRYHTSRNLLRYFRAWNTNYNTLSFIFGYSLY